MSNGYIKLYRQSLDSGIIQNARLWQFLSWCLLKASYKTHKQIVGNQEVLLQPGQFVFGRQAALRELKSTDSKIRTCLKNLLQKEFLTIRTTNKYSIITIVNWHIYQGAENDDNRLNNRGLTKPCPKVDHKQEKKNSINISSSLCSEDASRPSGREREKQAAVEGVHSAGNSRKAVAPEALSADSAPYQLAALMRDTLKNNLPTFKEPNLQKWAQSFDVALRNDERMQEPAFVAEVIKWACADGFWRANIQSPDKLLQKFDQLTAKMEVEAQRAKIYGASGNLPARSYAPPIQMSPYQRQRACQQSLARAVLQADRAQEQEIWPNC